MAINVIPINGHFPLLDYHELEIHLSKFIGNHCSEATLYVLNSFPAAISTGSDIDLLLLLSIEKKVGHYVQFNNADGRHYFYNAIIPLVINSATSNSSVIERNNQVFVDGVVYENEENQKSVKFGLISFLTRHCGFFRKGLSINPVELILNQGAEFRIGHILVGASVSVKNIFELIKEFPSEYNCSYLSWKNNENAYKNFKRDSGIINDTASKFSVYGFINRRKIERIDEQLSHDSKSFEYISKYPVIIAGKAGTGKTSQLMHLMIRWLETGQNVLFLTYNKALTHDVSRQVKQAKLHLISRAKKEVEIDGFRYGQAKVQTLMSFFYQLGKSLGVIDLMTAKRKSELEKKLTESLEFIYCNLSDLLSPMSKEIFATSDNSYEASIKLVQKSTWQHEVKLYAIDFIKYLKRENASLTIRLIKTSEAYFEHKMELLMELERKDMFLADYHGCLKNILQAIRFTEAFYEEFEVGSKYELLKELMALDTRVKDEALYKGVISLNVFKQRIENALKGRLRSGRILMVDEAQDCHYLEREIIYELMTPERVVLASGGAEQLIRYTVVCNWEAYNSRKLNIKKINAGSKSYRLKKNLLAFCNFLSEKMHMPLLLESFSDEDVGELIFDFRELNNVDFGKLFPYLLKKAEVSECTNYEGLLLLNVNDKDDSGRLGELQDNAVDDIESNINGTFSNTGLNSSGNGFHKKTIARVDEFDIIGEQVVLKKQQSAIEKELGKFVKVWSAMDSKKAGGDDAMPGSDEVRFVNYHSCRGLEAWSVMCLQLDEFYSRKLKEDTADTFRINEKLAFVNPASMYATTWTLMALTRAIDTLYIQLSESENELFKICFEYAVKHPGACTVKWGAHKPK